MGELIDLTNQKFSRLAIANRRVYDEGMDYKEAGLAPHG